MKIFVKNKDIRRIVEELQEYTQFQSIRCDYAHGYARLIMLNNYEIEVFRFNQSIRGHKSDFIVYDDDITDKEVNELIYPMAINRDDDIEPIVITYKQFLKMIRLF